MYKWISISIIIAALIGGFSFYKVQEMKQISIENQNRAKLNQEQSLEFQKKFDADKKKKELKDCIDEADTVYWDYVQSNKESESPDGTIRALTSVWNKAQEKKDKALDICYHLYQ